MEKNLLVLFMTRAAVYFEQALPLVNIGTS